MSVEAILNRYFSAHERLLFTPATSTPSLVKLQKDDAWRYRQLLGDRFASAKNEPPLALELTLLYFGLPVEPMLKDVFIAQQMELELDDLDDVEEYEVRPPLHFLTAYDKRSWGRDALKGRYSVEKATFNTAG
jgi:hypothetical protein